MTFSETFERRFWAKVERRGPDECWLWNAWVNNYGYGQISDGPRAKRKNVLASRASWALHTGKMPPAGVFVCHRCDNPRCVNPAHLFLGSQIVNMRDAAKKDRIAFGEGRPNTKLTATQARAIASDTRTHAAIAADFGVSKSRISAIKSGRSWSRDVPVSQIVKPERRKLSREAVRLIRGDRRAISAIARDFGVSRSLVCLVRGGKIYKEL